MWIQHHSHQLSSPFTHVHDVHEIVYNTIGSYDLHYFCGDQAQTEIHHEYGPHTLQFMPASVQHGISVTKYPYRRYFLQISQSELADILRSSTLESIFNLSIKLDHGVESPCPCLIDVSSFHQRVDAIFSGIYHAYMHSDIDNVSTALEGRSLLGELFCELYRNRREVFIQSLTPLNTTVLEVRKEIDRHYDRPLTVENLAKSVFITPGYLSHLFRNQMGCSPRQYLTRVRLSAARQLLSSEKMSVQEVCAEVGFSDINNFIRSFKMCYGMTPKQYQTKYFLSTIDIY